MICPFDIYKYFNSGDIAEHCKIIEHKFTAIETAYMVWHSNHHTLAAKHSAWQKIIDTMPDEGFPTEWDFNGHMLHSFLKMYMQLQSDFIKDFCTTKESYIYTCATLQKYDVLYSSDNIFFNSYEACFASLKNNMDDDFYGEIVKGEITRYRLYSSPISFEKAVESESIVFDRNMQIIDVYPSDYETGGDKKFLGPSYGFFEMFVVIPAPFKKGDIVTGVDAISIDTQSHKPFVLESMPYWFNNIDPGDYEGQRKRMIDCGADGIDMEAAILFIDSQGRIRNGAGYDYLDLEYFRDELIGNDRFLNVLNRCVQGKIGVEEISPVETAFISDNASVLRKCFEDNECILRVCESSTEKEKGRKTQMRLRQ